jgi:hypothetical protein
VAAARVEREPGAEVRDLADQVGVWGAMRNLIGVLAQGLRPALFPEVSVVGRLGHDCADDCSRGRAGGEHTSLLYPDFTIPPPPRDQ